MTEHRLAVERELVQISKQHRGVLRPEDVVAFAQDPKAALHADFTWDDSAAAAEYRLWQARQIIRVTVTILPGQDLEVRAYVSLMEHRTRDGGGYLSMARVLSDQDQRAAMLTEAKADMERFEQKYCVLQELADVFAAMAKVRGKGVARKHRQAV